MTETQHQLLDALLELEDTIQKMPGANPKPSLLPRFQRIDELTRALPPGTAPDLLHYLHKKSYQKARLWLQDRDDENAAGNCGHTH